MRVAVTGGAGFLGHHVVRELVEAGHTVRCLLRATTNASRLDGLAYERVLGDVGDAKTVQALVSGCDAVIHLALSAGWDQMRTRAQLARLLETSERGTRAVLDAAVAAGRVRVVFVSSIAAVNCSRTPDVVFDEASPPQPLAGTLGYAAVKRAAEALVASYARQGLPTVVLCPAEARPGGWASAHALSPVQVYGANDSALVTAGNLRTFLVDPVVVLPRTGGTSVCAAADVAAACVSALTRGRLGERYILGGPNLRVEELARATLQLAGGRHARTPVLRVPSALLLALVNALAWLRLPTPVEPGVLQFAVLFWFVDSAKAAAELGWPQRTAHDVLRPAVEWLRSEGHFK